MRRREGSSTLGLWLPIALARLIQSVRGICGKPPKLSEILGGFALPELAKAVRMDEEEGERDALAEWFEDMKTRADNGGQEDRHQAQG